MADDVADVVMVALADAEGGSGRVSIGWSVSITRLRQRGRYVGYEITVTSQRGLTVTHTITTAFERDLDALTERFLTKTIRHARRVRRLRRGL